MKNFFVLALVLFGALQSVSGYARGIRNAQNPAYPGMCYDPDTKTTLQKGSVTYQNCERWSCDNDYTLEIVGCGVAAARPGCQLKSDKSKQYPDCCPVEVCS